jgi:hypothetical protein
MDNAIQIVTYILGALIVGPMFMSISSDNKPSRYKTLDDYDDGDKFAGFIGGILWPITLILLVGGGIVLAIRPIVKYFVNKLIQAYGWIYAEVTEPRRNV